MASRAKGAAYAAEILTMIKEVRADHHACTAREVARRMKVTHTLLNRQLYQLYEMGLVTWTELQGSVCLTPNGGKFLSGVRAGKITALPGKDAPVESGVVVHPATQPAA